MSFPGFLLMNAFFMEAAEFRKFADAALWILGPAGITAVEQQIVVRLHHILRRYEFYQIFADLIWCFPL